MVYGTSNKLVTGDYKPTFTSPLGAPHCREDMETTYARNMVIPWISDFHQTSLVFGQITINPTTWKAAKPVAKVPPGSGRLGWEMGRYG